MTLNVVSYNKGTSFKDYQMACLYHKIEADEDSYKEALVNTINYFNNLVKTGQMHALMLQEVKTIDDALFNLFKHKQFKKFNILNNKAEKNVDRPFVDSTIVLSKDRFKDFKNYSRVLEDSTLIDGRDVAIVGATDKITQQRLLFVSAHLPGCLIDQGFVLEDDAAHGDKFAQTLLIEIDEISKKDKSTFQIIGADMNANPEKLDENRGPKNKNNQFEHRFKILNKAGFQTFRTNKATAVDFRSKTYKERELDFIFARKVVESGLFAKLFSPKTTYKHKETKTTFDFQLDENKKPQLASDHVPVKTEFIYK